MYIIDFEAEENEMTWREYALSRLQLGEFPKLPGVRRVCFMKKNVRKILFLILKGFCSSVNWANVKFDKEGLGRLFNALQSGACRLKRCKLSARSIQDLRPQVECRRRFFLKVFALMN